MRLSTPKLTSLVEARWTKVDSWSCCWACCAVPPTHMLVVSSRGFTSERSEAAWRWVSCRIAAVDLPAVHLQYAAPDLSPGVAAPWCPLPCPTAVTPNLCTTGPLLHEVVPSLGAMAGGRGGAKIMSNNYREAVRHTLDFAITSFGRACLSKMLCSIHALPCTKVCSEAFAVHSLLTCPPRPHNPPSVRVPPQPNTQIVPQAIVLHTAAKTAMSTVEAEPARRAPSAMHMQSE